MSTENSSEKHEDKALSQIAVSTSFLDHCESVAEELRLNGFDVKIVKYYFEITIEYNSLAGLMQYTCSEKTIMGDYYRFISHLGLKLHKWGLENKIKCYS